MSIEKLEGRVLLSASLIKDLNLNTAPSDPTDFVELNGVVYFSAAQNLYRTDGTFNGTSAVPGGPPFPAELTRLGNQIFIASSGGLWKFDGTSRATTFLGAGPINLQNNNAQPHNAGPAADNPRDLTPVGSILYFAKPDGAGHSALWRSDGTPAGTFAVPAATGLANPDSLTNLNGTLFFHASDAAHGDELWKTDGTAAGTVLVRDIFPGPTGSSLASFVNVNGRLYFTAVDGDHGLELWTSDGTAAGTVMVKDITPGPFGSAPSQLTNVNGTLYFVATDGAHGYELWKSDGTGAGTAMVLDINPGSAGAGIGDLTASGARLFFTASTPSIGTELWLTDGTAGGTRLVRDIAAGAASSLPSSLLNVNGTVYFHANDRIHGGEIWKSDGTASGTVMVKDIAPGSAASGATAFGYAGGAVYFAADAGTTGAELWKTDGTAAGTVLVRDINTRTAGSDTTAVVAWNGIGFFSGYDGIHGHELWRTDGTAAGTYMVADVNPGPGDSFPDSLTPSLDALYFIAGGLLYKTDGTAAGTLPVTSVLAPANLISLNGEIFFSGYDSGGLGLWVTDGTPAGTTLLRHFAGTGLALDDLTKVHSTLFFAADDGEHGMELWRSDGTPDGTVLVSDINPGPAGSGPWNITDVNGAAMFVADDGVHGFELWESDGTAAGTSIVADINPGPADAQISSPTYFAGALVFTANDGVHGDELWRSDGTPDGTFILDDLSPGPTDSSPAALTVAGSYLYFSAAGPNGRRLWETQGILGTTTQVPDADPNLPLSNPLGIVAVNQKATFVALNGGTWQVYQTDGLVAAPISSALPDPYFNPNSLGGVGDVLFFTAENAAHGPTIWSADLNQEFLPAAAGTSALPAGPASLSASPPADAAPTIIPPLVPGAFAYDSSIFGNEPNLASASIPAVYVAYGAQIYPANAPSGSPLDPTMIRAAADHASALHQPLVIDLETNADDGRFSSQGHVRATLQQLIQITQWVHQERPDVKVGFFGNLPPLYYSAQPIPNAGYTQFLAAVQQMLPLLPYVDFLCPVIYAPEENSTAFGLSAKVSIEAVANLGKPVLPFFSMIYQSSDPDLNFRPLPAEVWQDQLGAAIAEKVAPVMWGGWPVQWSDNAAWWAVTREQAAEAASPNPQFTPDVPLAQPAQPVGRLTIDFGVPVTGFSLADLSLTINNGPNLLGRGQSLSTTDHAKWTLFNLAPITSAGGKFVLTLRNSPAIRSSAGYVLLQGKNLTWSTPQVVGRYVYYNHSAFDGNDINMNGADDLAIATDKAALLPGTRATFANYTSYSRGINGIMIDIAGLTGTPTPSDFDFRTGNDNSFSQWQAAPVTFGPIVRPGAGVNGSTRLEFAWGDNAIQNTWLQVTVKADANTGLSAPDVFYFGNVIGESGNTPSADPVVDQADVQAALNDPHGASNPATITNPHDYNRDGRVDSADALIAAMNVTRPASAVHRIGYSTFADLLKVAQNYGGRGTRGQGDFTGDGIVDFKDLLVVAQNYMAAPATAAAQPALAAQPDDLLISRKLRPAARKPAPAPSAPPAP